MKEPVIVLDNVSKSYPLYHHITGGIKNFLFNLPEALHSMRNNRFEALKDISFNVHKGETLGIIGRNGAGKSTLLGLIAGVLKPSNGKIIVNGRISPLLELGGGFHPELTGRENIMLNGVLLGLTRSEVVRKMNEIIEFSELGEFIDQPIRVYSSGMFARLGFSVVAHLDPDILLIDEILAVGDMEFQKKCIDKMTGFKKNGVTMVFVSHSMADIERICDRVMWIENHTVKMLGKPEETVMLHKSSGDAAACSTASVEINSKMTDHYDEYLLKHINNKKINLVDIGAHRGVFVKMIEERIGIADAILVEPIPVCFEYLKAEFGSRYTVLNNLITDKATENVLFHIYDFAETSSVLTIKDIEEHAGVEIGLNSDINIDSITLDDLYTKHLKDTQIDLLKIDVQGAEHLVLAGADQALKHTNFVWVEVSFKQLYDNSLLFNDVYNMIAQSGFILIEISPGYRSLEGELLQADALFKNKNIPNRG